MKVGFLAPFNPVGTEDTLRGGHIGGVERYSDCLTRALADRGVDVTLVCSGRSNAVTHREGVRIVERRRLGILMRTPIAFLHRELSRDFDVIHVPATYPTYSEVLPVLARLRGARSVLDYHFDVPPGRGLLGVTASLYYALARRFFRLADAVIVKSRGYEIVSPGLRSVRPERIRTIPNGVDTTTHTPAANPARDCLLFVGRLVPYKGLDVLLDALALAPPSRRLPLHVVGTGPARGALAARAEKLDVPVTFEGYVSADRLRELYRNARATVLPSLTNQESFGIVLVESMACGTPVVASDLIGTRYVKDFGGALVPPGDARALSDALVACATMPPAFSGPALAESVHAAFSWQKVAESVEGVYASILDAPATSGRLVEPSAVVSPRATLPALAPSTVLGAPRIGVEESG